MAIADKFFERVKRALVGLGFIVRTSETSTLASDPTISGGSGAATVAEPNGSLWLRTDGPMQNRAGTAWRSLLARLSSNTAAGSSLTNSTDETVLGYVTVPASALVQGAILRFAAKVKVTADAGASTLTVRARLCTTTLGGTVLWASTATDTSANHIAYVGGELIARAAPGAAAAVEGVGLYAEPAAAGGALKLWTLDATNFATNGALRLEITGQWSAADANACQLEHLVADIG